MLISKRMNSNHGIHLLHLSSDSGEKNNLAAKSPELAQRLADKLNTWLDESDAQLPVKARTK